MSEKNVNNSESKVVGKEKINENIEKFKRLMKNKKGVKMFGFVFVAMGFGMGYVGGLIEGYSQVLSESFIIMGQYVMILGFIFIVYMIIGFDNKKKDKPKTEEEEEEELVEEIISSTEELEQKDVLDDIENSIENTTENPIKDTKPKSKEEEDGW